MEFHPGHYQAVSHVCLVVRPSRDHRYHFEPRTNRHTNTQNILVFPIIKDKIFLEQARSSRTETSSAHIFAKLKREKKTREREKEKKRNFPRHSFHGCARVNFPSALCPLKGHNKNIFVTKEVYIYCDKMEENTRFLF